MDSDYAALIAAGEVFVADEEGLAGVLVLRVAPDHLFVENVAVDPARQGQGVGRALLAFAERFARDHSLDELRLYTNQAMTENIKIYNRLGWRCTGAGQDQGFHRVHFSKRLEKHNE